jgi:predicted RNase H-like nuclease (RuvC/YqgF family)
VVNPSPIPIKIFCACGQKYAFEVHPHEGRMPVSIACPVCQRDGTDDANRIISKVLNGITRPLPPPSVNALLNSVQSSLEPHLVDALKDAVVQELAAQRRELLAAQQTAVAELTELARRLEAVQTPLLERLRAYEQRIAELEKELGEQSKENRELLKLKIDLLRDQIETERSASRVNFN